MKKRSIFQYSINHMSRLDAVIRYLFNTIDFIPNNQVSLSSYVNNKSQLFPKKFQLPWENLNYKIREQKAEKTTFSNPILVLEGKI